MNSRSVNELPLETCKHCGRKFIRCKSWEQYCRRPECQREYSSEDFKTEREKNRIGRQMMVLDPLPGEFGGYRKD